MICNLQMRMPRLKGELSCASWSVVKLMIFLSLSPSLPGLGHRFPQMCKQRSLGLFALPDALPLTQSFNLKVPGIVSSHCFQPLSEEFPHKSSERDRIGRRNWKKAADSSCSVYPAMFPWVLARSCLLGYADQSGDTHPGDLEQHWSVNYIFYLPLNSCLGEPGRS